jgi:hypothetical protein
MPKRERSPSPEPEFDPEHVFDNDPNYMPDTPNRELENEVMHGDFMGNETHDADGLVREYYSLNEPVDSSLEQNWGESLNVNRNPIVTKNPFEEQSTKKRRMGGRKWSRKYKRSINCKRPRGFSQKQYCKYG